MSQAEAPPRVYKFVAAFSRKRRRRNVATESTTANGCAAITWPLQDKPAAVPLVPPLSFESSNEENNDRWADHDYISSIERAPAVHTIPPVTTTDCEVPEAVTQPSIDDFCHVQDSDWSLNPFFDLEFPTLRPFHYIDSHHPLQVNLSVDEIPKQLGDDFPIINASQSRNNGVPALNQAKEAELEPSTTDELHLPSPGLQGASCNISLTLSQLLTRCTTWNYQLVLLAR